MLTSFILFIIGLIVGSFLNSVIYRLDDLKTIVTHRSHCPKCQKKLNWYELIPLASFVIQSGRCRSCNEKISWQYPIVELVTGLLFLFIYLKFGISFYSILLLLLSCFLIVIFVYDLYHMLIPMEMVWPAIIIAILLNCYIAVISGNLMPIWYSLLGAVAAGGFIGLIVLLTRSKGMGAGDIYLAIIAGLVCLWPAILINLFSAFVIGSVVGICLIIAGKKRLKSAIAFGPYLILGLYITIFWGDKILNWYLGI
ncbi:MAG: prepilin peptidase [Patescibacteria group bacterium]|nr:prepilin peptidase [Patescibacteria group bacterium]